MMASIAFPLFTLIHVVLLGVSIRLWRARSAPGSVIITLIIAGLVYDNLIIAIGESMGVGPTLELLSWPRFALHALLTPVSIIALMQMMAAAGIGWAAERRWLVVAWGLVAGMAAVGASTHLIGMDIVPACFEGTLRYSSSVSPMQLCWPDQAIVTGSGPPIPSIVTGLASLGAGFFIWRSTGWPWLLFGAVVMFFAAGVPISQFGPTASNGGEAVLLASYVATSARFAPVPVRKA